jgi:hypothetical protein
VTDRATCYILWSVDLQFNLAFYSLWPLCLIRKYIATREHGGLVEVLVLVMVVVVVEVCVTLVQLHDEILYT